MGSLMSGWDSQPLDDQKLMKRTNSSLTRNEISAFWRSRQRSIEQHLKEEVAQVKATTTRTHHMQIDASSAILLEKPKQAAEDLQQPIASNPNWWTRSNWAFLNFPPEMLLTDC